MMILSLAGFHEFIVGSPGFLLCGLMLFGLLALSFGGDWLTTGAATLSLNLKMSPVLVGLTIVSMATSMPEMLTSLFAAFESPGLAMGTIVGSNLANTGLILGVTALILPLRIQLRLIQREVPLLLGATGLFYSFSFGQLTRWEGLILLLLLLSYLVYIVIEVRQGAVDKSAEFDEEIAVQGQRSTWSALFLLSVGVIGLSLGAEILVQSSVELAGRMGVSPTLIGLTVLALGTSLPELAACVAAARAGHSGICAGNIVGSNLFNLLLIGGGVAAINPIPVARELLYFEMPALIVLTLGLVYFFKTGHTVTRKEGGCLVLYYLLVMLAAAWMRSS
jgi:cation:H+ antiporter